MNKLAALFAAPLLAIPLSVAAQPDVVSPLPGVDGQTAPSGTLFPVDLTVYVSNAGQPVPFKQVDFQAANGDVFFASSGSFSGHEFAITDANGYATAPGVVAFVPGSTVVNISSVGNDAGTTSVALNVVPGTLARLEEVSGSRQKATVGTPYAQPWIVQAFDASGNVVKDAAVQFSVTADPALPSGTFNGATSVFVRADADGIAKSPLLVANGVAGKDEGSALGFRAGGSVQGAFFEYTNVAVNGGGGSGDGCGAQNKGNGNCGNGHGANHGK